MTLRIFNTLSRRKEEFRPRTDKQVHIYVCGPTTYNYIHLGNARPIVVFDTIRRYLQYSGYEVRFVQNFTDVDDKIINRSHEEGISPHDLAGKYIEEYFRDAESLNVMTADIHPRVTEHMDSIIEMVKALEERGHAYAVGGNVYFDVRTFKPYGKLSGRSLDEMKAGARVEVEPDKKYPLDFALWKAAGEDEPGWQSPWGRGRPGWHIECSAMSVEHLGMSFDIHGGGSDLIFPHHENEIAQAEGATGMEPFARYWIHNGFITVNEEKMSKSLGNFFLVRDILKKFPGDVVRFYLLSTHYRSPLDFDDEKLEASGRGLERIKTAVAALDEASEGKGLPGGDAGGELKPGRFSEAIALARREFESAMDDDFNTALATAALFDFCRAVNTYINEDFVGDGGDAKLVDAARRIFADLGGGVLGILFDTHREGRQEEDPVLRERLAELLADLLDAAGKDVPAANLSGSDLIAEIVSLRESARQRKDWRMADAVRDRLGELRIEIKDTPKGPKWNFGDKREVGK